MYIERKDIEIIVQTIIDERFQGVMDSLQSAAYAWRDHSGALESKLASGLDDVVNALNSSIEEAAHRLGVSTDE